MGGWHADQVRSTIKACCTSCFSSDLQLDLNLGLFLPHSRAIERGQWVLLDNANLCNPTVLDRLNPLLEPNGVLYLNECGNSGAGPRMVRPHPNFRLFLAMDPRWGSCASPPLHACY